MQHPRMMSATSATPTLIPIRYGRRVDVTPVASVTDDVDTLVADTVAFPRRVEAERDPDDVLADDEDIDDDDPDAVLLSTSSVNVSLPGVGPPVVLVLVVVKVTLMRTRNLKGSTRNFELAFSQATRVFCYYVVVRTEVVDPKAGVSVLRWIIPSSRAINRLQAACGYWMICSVTTGVPFCRSSLSGHPAWHSIQLMFSPYSGEGFPYIRP